MGHLLVVQGGQLDQPLHLFQGDPEKKMKMKKEKEKK